GIDRDHVVILCLEKDETGEHHDKRPSQHPVATALASEEEPDQSACPERKEDRIQDHSLIGNKCDWTTSHVAVAHADVVNQFQKRKMVAHLPDEVGQRNHCAG